MLADIVLATRHRERAKHRDQRELTTIHLHQCGLILQSVVGKAFSFVANIVDRGSAMCISSLNRFDHVGKVS
jgi:hypothetical protein